MNKKGENSTVVKQISKICSDYLSYISSFGNECAYTDEILRHIAEAAAKLSLQA